MPDPRLDLPQSTLDLLIFTALSLEPMHGWAMSYYQLTRTGRKPLASDTDDWARLSEARQARARHGVTVARARRIGQRQRAMTC